MQYDNCPVVPFIHLEPHAFELMGDQRWGEREKVSNDMASNFKLFWERPSDFGCIERASPVQHSGSYWCFGIEISIKWYKLLKFWHSECLWEITAVSKNKSLEAFLQRRFLHHHFDQVHCILHQICFPSSNILFAIRWLRWTQYPL